MDLPKNLETIILNEQTNYRLMEIGKIKDYFEQEIKCQQNLTSKLGKYLICFDYTDKILTVSLTVFSETNIFAHVKGRKQLLCLIYSVFSAILCLSSGIIKKLQQKQKEKRKNTTDCCI